MRATRPSKSFRRAALVAGLALALIAMLALAPPARAGTYVAVQCHPDYDLAAANAVFSRTSDHYVPAAACGGSGPGLQITNNADATKDGRYGAWSWYPPAGTEFAHITSEAHVSHDAGHKGFVTIIDAAGGVHWRWPAAGSWQPVEWSAGSSAAAYTAWLQCYGSGGNCGRSGAAHSYVRRLWFTLRDRSAPTLSLGGSLFEPGPRRGSQTAQLGVRRRRRRRLALAPARQRLPRRLGRGGLRHRPRRARAPLRALSAQRRPRLRARHRGRALPQTAPTRSPPASPTSAGPRTRSAPPAR